MLSPVANQRQRESGFRVPHGFQRCSLAAALAACAPDPEPRTVRDLMENGLAREGVLARCNRDRDATFDGEECANARRACSRGRAVRRGLVLPALEQESESQAVGAPRARGAIQTGPSGMRKLRRPAIEAAYEARWRDPAGPRARPATSPKPGARVRCPAGHRHAVDVESDLFAVYAEDTDPLGRPTFEVAAAEPPSNEARHRFAAPRDDGSRHHSAPVPRRRGGTTPRFGGLTPTEM